MQSYGQVPESSKVETPFMPVKTHPEVLFLAEATEFAYFCVVMRFFGRIAYWVVAVVLIASILASLDYSLGQAILIALIFCPCALLLAYLMPKARKPMDKVYLSLAVMVSVILLILLLHYFVWIMIYPESFPDSPKEVPPMRINPAFLGIILTTLSIGDYFCSKWLSRRFKPKDRTITFFSERKSVTLLTADILYIESNDTEVRIVTVSSESYRNKTGIGQWENLLGEDFLRIHRSYLVNLDFASLTSAETVSVGDTQLPVSRKYKENVQQVLHKF